MNRSYTKLTALLLALMLTLCACGKEPVEPVVEPTEEPLTLTIRAGASQDTLDPAYCTAQGSDTVLYHIYENLMRWENDGNGFATLAPGQASGYTVETDYAGNATYTFTLRSGILWSDGKSVTAHHFVSAWKRLADPATESPYRELMNVIAGYDQVTKTGDPDFLQVHAADAETLVVTLSGNSPYFLEEICAGVHTMPVRPALLEGETDTILSNGPYTLASFSPGEIVLEKNENYYESEAVTAESIRILPTTDSESDYESFLNGETDLVENLPLSALSALAEAGNWTSEPMTATCAVLLNTLQAPFDRAEVRSAFRLVINEEAIVEALGDFTSRPAIGLVPYGVTDYGVRTAPAEEAPALEENTMPDPNAPQIETEEPLPEHWDFRAHGREIVTMDADSDHTADCELARELFAAAGYKDGVGFPAVEYIYVDSARERTVAELLVTMWEYHLGVTVNARAVTQEEYDLMLTPTENEDEIVLAPFQMASAELSAIYNDASALLGRWHSAGAENCIGYASPAFDILLNTAKAAVSPESYDAYLHDAEAILLEDAPVIPLCYRGSSYCLADGLEGLYRAPNGVYFLSRVTRSTAQ